MFGFTEAPFYIATKTLLLLKEKAESFPCSNSHDTVKHVHARCHFLKALQLKHVISLIIASFVVMAFCSFASVVGRTCGPSPENPNVVVHFVDLKNCDRDVKALSKFCTEHCDEC